MIYTSPFLNPAPYIAKVDNLTTEAIAIDEGVGRATREAKDFSAQYSADFALVSELNEALQKVEPRWTKSLLNSRDAASALTGWLKRFNGVFLAMINDVTTESDAKDLVIEFQAFQNEGHPLDKYNLDNTPGPKKAFHEIQDLADKESAHVVSVMQDAKDWHKGLKELKSKLPAVQQGVTKIEGSLEKYASTLSQA